MKGKGQRLFHGVSRACVGVARMTTIAEVSFKGRALESTVVASALSILSAIVRPSAVFWILKWKIAIGPLAIGFGPPERTQRYR